MSWGPHIWRNTSEHLLLLKERSEDLQKPRCVFLSVQSDELRREGNLEVIFDANLRFDDQVKNVV